MRLERSHKYGARATVIDGIKFPSAKEAGRYVELKLLEDAGEIRELEIDAVTPLRYELAINGIRLCYYRPDFRYVERGRVQLEDVKGFCTPVFKLKAKLFAALYPDLRLTIL